MKKEIFDFNPSIHVYEKKYKKYLNTFKTGKDYPEKGLGDYIQNESLYDKESGDGVSYIVLHRNEKNEIEDVVAYFTLVSSSIPCLYRCEEEGEEPYETMFGIPAVRIHMFAVNEKYQDTFFRGELIAGLIFKAIIAKIDVMSRNGLGIKAIYLYSIPSAKNFYKKNNLLEAEEYMQKFSDGDDDCDLMYVFIREVHNTYEKKRKRLTWWQRFKRKIGRKLLNQE